MAAVAALRSNSSLPLHGGDDVTAEGLQYRAGEDIQNEDEAIKSMHVLKLHLHVDTVYTLHPTLFFRLRNRHIRDK